jgi:hypothetical protein
MSQLCKLLFLTLIGLVVQAEDRTLLIQVLHVDQGHYIATATNVVLKAYSDGRVEASVRRILGGDPIRIMHVNKDLIYGLATHFITNAAPKPYFGPPHSSFQEYTFQAKGSTSVIGFGMNVFLEHATNDPNYQMAIEVQDFFTAFQKDARFTNYLRDSRFLTRPRVTISVGSPTAIKKDFRVAKDKSIGRFALWWDDYMIVKASKSHEFTSAHIPPVLSEMIVDQAMSIIKSDPFQTTPEDLDAVFISAQPSSTDLATAIVRENSPLAKKLTALIYAIADSRFQDSSEVKLTTQDIQRLFPP